MSVQGINIPLDVGATIVPLYGKTGNNTAREDNPSAPSPAVIYDMRNVMPSELGYSSAFDPVNDMIPGSYSDSIEYTRLISDASGIYRVMADAAISLKLARIQQVIPFETGSQDLIYIILTEMGIYAHAPADSYGDIAGYDLLVPITSENTELYHLWTWAIIDNRMYVYLQGQDRVFVIGDSTLLTDLESWKSEVTELYSSEDYLLSIVSAVPTFLNMDGQVGIFQAGNRLGFWDSDNATAWGSAFDKLDFEPDVVSLAGITKFSDVQGDIVIVRPTLEGFIIYSTASIVEIRPLRDSTEKWGATTILRGTGVDYHTHVAVGSDPAVHYAWARDGLYLITQGKANPIKSEEYAELTQETGKNLYALYAIGNRYLIISQSTEWLEQGAELRIRTGTLPGEGGNYIFYLPVARPFVPEHGWAGVIRGDTDDMPPIDPYDYEIDPSALPPLSYLRPMVPCYSGWKYVGPLNMHLLAVEDTDTGSQELTTLTSGVFPEITATYMSTVCDIVGGILPNPMSSTLRGRATTLQLTGDDWKAHKSPGQTTEAFYDQAGTDFLNIVTESINKFQQQVATLWNDSPSGMNYPIKLVPTGFVFCHREGQSFESATTGWHVQGFSLDQILGGEPGEYERPTVEEPIIWEALLSHREGELKALEAEVARLELERQKFPRSRELVNLLQNAKAARDTKALEVTETSETLEAVYLRIEGSIPHEWDSIKVLKVPNAAKGLPLNNKVVVQQDSCGLRVYAYIDDFDFLIHYGMEPQIFSVAERHCNWDEEEPQVINATVETRREGPFCFNIWSASIYNTRYWAPVSLKGKTLAERRYLLSPESIGDNPCWVPIFEADISGYGYVQEVTSSWTIFRKVISRARLDIMNEDGECTPVGRPKTWTHLPDEEHIDENWYYKEWDVSDDYHFELPPEGPEEPDIGGYPKNNEWGWPSDIHWAAKYRKGAKHPYYPRYDKAWVLDLSLNKWGSLDWPHSHIFPTMPVNSGTVDIAASHTTDWVEDNRNALDRNTIMPFGIIPKFIEAPSGSGYYWQQLRRHKYSKYTSEFLRMHQLPTFLLAEGNSGKITIGTTGMTREGMTKLTGLYGDSIRHANVVVKGSYYGRNFGNSSQEDFTLKPYRPQHTNDVRLYFALSRDGREGYYKDFRSPFVLVGKEFEIAVEGNFRLHKLICYGQPTGRLSFHGVSSEARPQE